MESVGVDEIGLMDTQVVAFPVDLFSGNRALVLSQDSSNAAPGSNCFINLIFNSRSNFFRILTLN